ncbi:fasciclin domain-containing protein [Psychroflexus planctonicus]|uniref:FAS1 domain-containing protein n=1 Tax=Psychroflexus planctonicus TaxID=1526575 RepID=A0ABQ1SGS8_9FLAO|nr:fasciclin domain-containing protein [Psychroflexus planctonicus]GGE39278.1 hypothetical protein GCM10010832_19430 [Psychroflexus planctonicus]
MTLQQLSVKLPFLFIFTLFISCDQDDSNTQPILGLPTTSEIIANSDEHVILSNLLTEYGLDEVLNEGTFTIFAPIDAAFENIDTNNFSESEMINFLLNHVVQGNATSGDLSNRYLDTQASVTINERESNLSLLVTLGENIFLNASSQVIEPDLEASNGTIHIVDQVIETPKLSTFVNNDPNFAFLFTALSREDQPDYLETLDTNLENEPAPITLFAPSNEAFTTALSLLGLEDLDQIDAATLTEILNLHLLTNSNLREIDFTEENIQTLGGDLAYDTENNVIVDINGREIEFATRDVQTTNGVLHVIEDVILPESDLEDPDEDEDVNFTLDNEANLAYFVSEIEGNEDVSTLSENNSTWTLSVGSRYNINVVNAGSHPLELRDGTNETLLAQSEAIEGNFENDEEVNFSVEGTIFSFTLTQELANQLSSYFCSNHPAINGSIIVN